MTPIQLCMKRVLSKIPGGRATYLRLRTFSRLPRFRKEFQRFGELSRADGRFPELDWGERWPCLDERSGSLSVEPHYTYHPAWAARILAETKPQQHVDVASSLTWAVVTSAFVPIRYVEFRPPRLVELSDFTVEHGSVERLPFGDGSVPSLSCMHTLEHVGLGRYGDSMDPGSDRRGAAELARVLAPGGDLLFVVPVGRPTIRFNAERIYSYELVLDLFPDLGLREFVLILEDGSDLLQGEAAVAAVPTQREGCGCFWFRKPPSGTHAMESA